VATPSNSPARDDLLTSLREVAERLATDYVSRSTWERETGTHSYHVYKLFESWNEFVKLAGLRADDRSRVADEDLFEAMRAAFIDAEGVVTRGRLSRFCRYGDDVYAKRWGRWQNVLAHFRDWVETADPEFPYLADLPTDSVPAASRGSAPTTGHSAAHAWDSIQRTQYGPFLNFRGLQHAPINEQGVVFLFGMVAFDLGYVVEGVGTGFPDCEAKRCVSRSGDVWERVSIEFEFRSRNFLSHGHDPSGCDVIVCWEHNWPECPVEVLELRAALDELGEPP
jgi:Homing endonuclease associated repeat